MGVMRCDAGTLTEVNRILILSLQARGLTIHLGLLHNPTSHSLTPVLQVAHEQL